MPKSYAPVLALDDHDEIVVFLVGMTFNKPWRVRRWWPVFSAMPKMLRELEKDPQSGLLSWRLTIGRYGPTVIQYWRSSEQLDAYARGRGNEHSRAWAAFARDAARGPGDVGLWHETYLTRPGTRENLYIGTPLMGFADAVGGVRPVRPGEETGRKRRAAQLP